MAGLSKEKYIEKYGEEWYTNYIKKLSKKISNSRKKRNTNTEKHWIEIYGEVEGKRRWKEKNKKCILSEINFIKRYGEIDGKKRWQNYLQKNKKHLDNINFNTNITRKRSHLTVEHWINKGFTESEAKEKIFNFQSKMSKRRHINTSYYKDKNELCIEYWINKGFTIDEAEIILINIKEKYNLTKENFIKKYGKENGIKKYKECNENLKICENFIKENI